MEEHAKEMMKISKADWDAISSDFKGVWQDYYNDHPEWIGKRVVMSSLFAENKNELGRLLIEDVDFIVEDSKSLNKKTQQMKTELYKDVTTNTLMTYDEVKEAYANANNSDLPIDDDTMYLIIMENLTQNGGNIQYVSENTDPVLRWCNKYSEYNEAGRYLSQSERDESVKNIYESISMGGNSLCEDIIKGLSEDKDDKEAPTLLTKLEELMSEAKGEKPLETQEITVRDRYAFYFEGYKVPDKLQDTAIAIMRRFTITGLADGMYICNRMALSSGIGDGEGHFYDDALSDYDKVAESLRSAYGCNIFKEDLKELEDILKTGKLDIEKAEVGINNYIEKCRKEQMSCEPWRAEYLEGCILEAKSNLLNLKLENRDPNKERTDNLLPLGLNADQYPLYVQIVCADKETYEAVVSTPKNIEDAYEKCGWYSKQEEPVCSAYHQTPDAPVFFTNLEYEFLVENIFEYNDIVAIYPSSKEAFLSSYLEGHYDFYSPDLSEYPKEEKTFLDTLIQGVEERISSAKTEKEVSSASKKVSKEEQKKTQDKKNEDVTR